MEVEKIEKLEEKEQKHLKIFSKITYILAKVAEVCCYIGAVALVLVVFLVPFITSNIKYAPGEITIFEDKITYVKENEKYTITNGEQEHVFEKAEEVMVMDGIVKVLEQDLLNKYVPLVEIVIVAGIIAIILAARELRYVNKIFKNVHNEDTPFTMQNVEFIKKVAYLLIAIFVVGILKDIITDMVYMNDAFYNDNLKEIFSGSNIDIFKVLIILCLGYIAKYGTILQSKSKKKIYE